jgi:hypothetical protein
MTYAILSLASGNFVESYRTMEGALDAAARIHATEPEAMPEIALVTFDDAGAPVEGLDGPDLIERVQEFAAEHHGATA